MAGGGVRRYRPLAAFGVTLAAVLVRSSPATAEIPLAQYHGWQLTTGGRVNAFLSVAAGDGLPAQEPALPGAGTVDANNSSGDLRSTRVRDGLLTSILGFTGFKEISADFKVTTRVALWMNVSSSRHQNVAGLVDPRELYGKVEGRWGSVLAGQRQRPLPRRTPRRPSGRPRVRARLSM